MIKLNYKNIILPIIFALILFIVSIINTTIKSENRNLHGEYKNTIKEKILSNDFNDIKYKNIIEDFEYIDSMLNKKIAESEDTIEKTKIYETSYNIYKNKLYEIISILNNKLNDEDFGILENDISEFEKNIDFAITEMENKIISSIDFKYYKNKYLYEEYRQKYISYLNIYKGYLN